MVKFVVFLLETRDLITGGGAVPDAESSPNEDAEMPDLRAEAEEVYRQFRRQRDWPVFHGATPPAATTLWQGVRVVIAGPYHYTIPVEESWYGFLYGLLIEQIGDDWFDREMEKPRRSSHPLVQWYRDISEREYDDELGCFTRHDPENDIGTTFAFRSIAYDVFCMMQASNLSSKLMERLRDPGQFEGARYELWVAATLSRAGFLIEFFDEDDRSSKHGEGIAIYRETGKRFWFEAKRKHRPNFDYLQALIDKVTLKVDAKLIAAAMQKPANDDRLLFIDLNRPPWGQKEFAAPWIKAFRKSINRLELQKQFRENYEKCAFVLATNHPYHFVSNVRPDPKNHFVATTFNMVGFDWHSLEAEYPEVYSLMQSIRYHFAIPEGFLETS